MSEYKKRTLQEEMERQRKHQINMAKQTRFSSYEILVAGLVFLILIFVFVPLLRGFIAQAKTAKLQANARTMVISLRYVYLVNDFTEEEKLAFARKYQSWQSTTELDLGVNIGLVIEKKLYESLGTSRMSGRDMIDNDTGRYDYAKEEKYNAETLGRYLRINFDESNMPSSVDISDDRSLKSYYTVNVW